MHKNVLIMERARYETLRCFYFELERMLDVYIIVDDDSFEVRKNRYDQFLSMRKKFPLTEIDSYLREFGPRDTMPG